MIDPKKLQAWFTEEKRDLPWRQTTDPYAIWISEVMLQQTQVAVVIPYFMHWMNRFPTITQLAQAELDEVIKAWEGLGYYSRARNLHVGARFLVEHCNGQLPQEENELKKIKGLGPYTIGAIRSFAFHQKTIAVDGNVLRVLTRYFGLEDDISKPVTVNKLRQLAYSLLPEKESWIFNEALLELGATVCQRKARCRECPLQEGCVSLKKGWVDRLPIKSKKFATEYLFRAVAVVQCGASFLVKRGQKGEIMSDLYEFPYFTVPEGGIAPHQFQKEIHQRFALSAVPIQQLSEVTHGFTRYRVRLYPALFTLPGRDCNALSMGEGCEWLSLHDLKQLAFSSGHRRIFQQLQTYLASASHLPQPI